MDFDDEGPSIISLDDCGTNPDPSMMIPLFNAHAYGSEDFSRTPTPPQGSQGMPPVWAAPDGRRDDPYDIAKTMYEAYLKGHGDALGRVSLANVWTPPMHPESSFRSASVPMNQLGPQWGQGSQSRSMTPPNRRTPPLTVPYDPTEETLERQQREIDELQKQLTMIRSSTVSGHMPPPPVLTFDMEPTSRDDNKSIKSHHSNRSGFTCDGDGMTAIVGAGGCMADADLFAVNHEPRETEISLDEGSEWLPAGQPSYVQFNVKTIDRSQKILPYEANMLGKPGTLIITVTMYNEDWGLFDRTMRGVIRNLKFFVAAYGEKMLTKITVVIVSDGRTKMDEGCKEAMIKHGFIDSRLDDPCEGTAIHTFYNRFCLKSGVKSYGPLQVLTVIKEGNGGKLHSHKVLMHGFCMRIAPTYVFLLDCGTMPNKDALFKLYDYMEREPGVGGCAGEIEADPSWCNGVVMSQVFEYKVAHIFDKAAESMLGFVSVLPGAFSAYRYRALTDPDEETGKCPLDKYFDGLTGEFGPFESNIYLAEDRILGFELIARNGTSYSLKYVPGSVARTDVPQHVDDLLKQRKRWLNGALFALFYSFIHMKQFYTSGLPCCRKMMISFELFMLTLLTLINLVGLGMYYLLFKFVVFDVLIQKPGEISLSDDLGTGFAHTLNFSFIFVLFIQVVFGLGNSQPTHIKIFYNLAVVYFAIFQIIVLLFAFYFVTKQGWVTIILVVMGSGLYFVGAIVHQPKDVLLIAASFPWYTLLMPLYVVILPIRAFANIHDISWGTKGLEDSTANARKQTFQRFRSIFILVWLALNGGVVTLCIALQSPIENFSDVLLKTAFYIAAGMNVCRFLALCYIRCAQGSCTGSRRRHDDHYRQEDPENTILYVVPHVPDGGPVCGPTLVRGMNGTIITPPGVNVSPPPIDHFDAFGEAVGTSTPLLAPAALYPGHEKYGNYGHGFQEFTAGMGGKMAKMAYGDNSLFAPPTPTLNAPCPTPSTAMRAALMAAEKARRAEAGFGDEEPSIEAIERMPMYSPRPSGNLTVPPPPRAPTPRTGSVVSSDAGKKARFAAAHSVIPPSDTADWQATVTAYLGSMTAGSQPASPTSKGSRTQAQKGVDDDIPADDSVSQQMSPRTPRSVQMEMASPKSSRTASS